MLLEMTEGSRSQVSRALKSSCDCFLFVLCCNKSKCGSFNPPCHHGKEIKREFLILEIALVFFYPPQMIKWSHPAAQGLLGRDIKVSSKELGIIRDFPYFMQLLDDKYQKLWAWDFMCSCNCRYCLCSLIHREDVLECQHCEYAISRTNYVHRFESRASHAKICSYMLYYLLPLPTIFPSTILIRTPLA